MQFKLYKTIADTVPTLYIILLLTCVKCVLTFSYAMLVKQFAISRMFLKTAN